MAVDIEIVCDVFEGNCVDFYLQFIVILLQCWIVFYESFICLCDVMGCVIVFVSFIGVVECVGLMIEVDNFLFFWCVQIVCWFILQDCKIVIFCNILLNLLVDEIFFLIFLDFICQYKYFVGLIIFEVLQKVFVE